MQAVEACGVMGTFREAQFDSLIFTAAQLLRAPMAMLAVIETEKVWLKSRVGPLPSDWPRAASFCHTVIENDEPLVVEDTTKSVRFSQFPLVTEHPHIRFYAGAPIHGPDNHVVATLCVLDRQSRVMQDRAYQQLLQLARDAENILRRCAGYA